MKNSTGKNKIITLAQSTISTAEVGEKSKDWDGVRFRKQIAKFGDWINPLNPFELMVLDDAFADEMIANFEDMRSGKNPDLPRVAVPINHTDDTQANTGEVVALDKGIGDEEPGLYATLEIKKWETTGDIDNGTIFDVSMSFSWDFIDTREGKHHGIVLEHVALVNNPYLTGMKQFERAPEQKEWDEYEKKLWEDQDMWYDEFSKQHVASAVMLSKSKVKEKLSMLESVKNDRDFDVVISVNDEDGEAVEYTIKAGESIDVPADQAEAVRKQIADAKDPEADDKSEDNSKNNGGESLSNDDPKDDEEEDESKADPESKPEETQLSKTERAELSKLRKEKAELSASKDYNELLSQGFIVPAQKDAFIELHKAQATMTSKVKLSRDGKDEEFAPAEALLELFKSGGKRVDFSQAGKKTETTDDTKDVAVSKTISKKNLEGLKANGVTAKQIDELANKSPLYAEAMKKYNK